MEHVPPKAAIVPIVPQVWGNEKLKSPGSAPPKVMDPMTIGVLVLFVIVKVGAVLEAPTATWP